jgi:cytochrome oxidase Cu insertion factor (SCO1/SenC/PrrC family)
VGTTLWISLAALAVLLVPVSGLAAQHDVTSLLDALGIAIPARPFIAPPFSLPDLGGAAVRLADYQGQVVMLYFWTTW